MAGVRAQYQTMNSHYTNSPPIIDGRFSPSDTWSNPQLVLTSPPFPIYTFVYFMHDASNLYVLVDATDDNTDDALDQCLLVFNFTDVIAIRVIGNSTDHTVSPDFQADIGFTGSPNNSSAHKIYEFSISLSYINATPGSSIDFCSPYALKFIPPSMPYDASTFRDNVYPPGVDTGTIGNIEYWSRLTITLPAVGGEIISVSGLALLAPWIILTAVAFAIGFALMRRRLFLH